MLAWIGEAMKLIETAGEQLLWAKGIIYLLFDGCFPLALLPVSSVSAACRPLVLLRGRQFGRSDSLTLLNSSDGYRPSLYRPGRHIFAST